MKFLASFALALIAIIAVVSARNSTWGSRGWNHQLLYRQSVVIKGSNMNPRPSYNLTFPLRAGANTKQISYIQVLDLNRFGNGGHATLYKGGINYKNVTILFKSEAPTGLNVTTEIWGR